MKSSRLTQLQRDVLEAFFGKESRFFLSGGGALAGFHLGHRETDDLDLFTTEDVLDQGATALGAVARGLGATSEEILTTPDFRRRLLRRGPESVIVDLVRERVVQIVPDKPVIAGIRVDPAEEIMANKLCALLARSEVRDLVDLRALEAAGLPLGARPRGGRSQRSRAHAGATGLGSLGDPDRRRRTDTWRSRGFGPPGVPPTTD